MRERDPGGHHWRTGGGGPSWGLKEGPSEEAGAGLEAETPWAALPVGPSHGACTLSLRTDERWNDFEQSGSDHDLVHRQRPTLPWSWHRVTLRGSRGRASHIRRHGRWDSLLPRQGLRPVPGAGRLRGPGGPRPNLLLGTLGMLSRAAGTRETGDTTRPSTCVVSSCSDCECVC